VPGAPQWDQAWFERKVAELKAQLEKLRPDRQEQLRGDLDEEKKQYEEDLQEGS
jgi:hypothetical protein